MGLSLEQKAYLQKDKARKASQNPRCIIDIIPHCFACGEKMIPNRHWGNIKDRTIVCDTEGCDLVGIQYHMPFVALKKKVIE